MLNQCGVIETITGSHILNFELRKNNTILEIIPYLIGMRKDGADGFWVPIGVCARYIGDNLYVPVRAVAEELGITVGWDGSTQTVSLTSAVE